MNATATPAPQSAPTAAPSRVSRRRYVPPVFAPTTLRPEIPADELHRIFDLRIASAVAFRAACHRDDTDPADLHQAESATLWAEWDRVSDLAAAAFSSAREIYAPFPVPRIPRGPARCIMLPFVLVEVSK